MKSKRKQTKGRQKKRLKILDQCEHQLECRKGTLIKQDNQRFDISQNLISGDQTLLQVYLLKGNALRILPLCMVVMYTIFSSLKKKLG